METLPNESEKTIALILFGIFAKTQCAQDFFCKAAILNAIPPHAALIVIPTYNEAQNIEPLLAAIWKASPDIHLLVVDDKSQDGMDQIISRLQKEHGHQLFFMQRPGKMGLGSAYLSGFAWALQRNYQAIIEMDADFSHNPNAVPAMLAGLERSAAVIGSRYTKGGSTENWHPLRRAISRFGSFYSRLILGVPLHDLTGGFNAWRREALEAMDLKSVRSEGYSFQIELKYRCFKAGMPMSELPIVFSERREGFSKMSWKIVAEALYRVWTFRFHRR